MMLDAARRWPSGIHRRAQTTDSEAAQSASPEDLRMDAPDRRIAAVSAHLAATAEPASPMPDAGAPDAGAPEFTGVASDPARLIEEFAMRGMVVLGPGDIGVPMELHRTVFEKEKIAVQEGLGGFILSRVPEVVDVM